MVSKRMESKVLRTLRSNKNNNVYNLYKERIVVQNGTNVKELHMPAVPAGQSGFECFYDIYYIQNKLFAVLITGSGFDMRIEIDEETLDYAGAPITNY
jgi:hypothetical protein